jgi:hypothetical protein
MSSSNGALRVTSSVSKCVQMCNFFINNSQLYHTGTVVVPYFYTSRESTNASHCGLLNFPKGAANFGNALSMRAMAGVRAM